MDLKKELQEFPFIAITRGIRPERANSTRNTAETLPQNLIRRHHSPTKAAASPGGTITAKRKAESKEPCCSHSQGGEVDGATAVGRHELDGAECGYCSSSSAEKNGRNGLSTPFINRICWHSNGGMSRPPEYRVFRPSISVRWNSRRGSSWISSHPRTTRGRTPKFLRKHKSRAARISSPAFRTSLKTWRA